MNTNGAPGAQDNLREREKEQLLRRARAATELLEAIDADRQLLDQLPVEDRERLHLAVAQVYEPDPVARRRRVKALERERHAAAAERTGSVLDQTGIRVLRRQPVLTTPNFYPPEGFEQHEGDEHKTEFREPAERPHCYVCKQKYSSVHFFYDQLCPPCAAFNFTKRTELADLSGRTALLTGGRVKIGFQAGLKLLRERRQPDRYDSTLSVRLGRALCAGAGFQPVGGIVSKSSRWTCVTRRAWRLFAARSPRLVLVWTSLSITRARRCGGRRSSIVT